MFIIKIKKHVLITYLGVIFGVISMLFAFTKIAFQETEYMSYSLIFLILAGICDMFDGKIARMCDRTEEEKQFGIQIDSLADTVNFVVLPVVIMLALGMTSVIDAMVYVLFIICGISRLAVFNCNINADEVITTYTGLPVTSVAMIYPLLGLLHRIVSQKIFENLSIAITLVVAILFVSNIKVPKFRKWAYIVAPICGVIVSILLLVVKRCIMF